MAKTHLTVGDLRRAPEGKRCNRWLLCGECGGEYSGDPRDYFRFSDETELRCCGPLELRGDESPLLAPSVYLTEPWLDWNGVPVSQPEQQPGTPSVRSALDRSRGVSGLRKQRKAQP